jgi:DNA-binding GntR family transcriptional regulator
MGNRAPDDGAHTGRLPRLPRRQPLWEDVYEAIKASLMDHVITPGERLSIDALSRDLQVSQTPVREALARLEADGLLVKAPLRGYSVTPLLTRDELDDLFGLRLLLEPWGARSAAERADADAVGRLRDELASMDEAPDGTTYEHYKALAAHDARFHLLVLDLAGNAAVRGAFERTHCHLHMFRFHHGAGMQPLALAEHRRVVQAIAESDPAQAEEAMRAHLVAARARLMEVIT